MSTKNKNPKQTDPCPCGNPIFGDCCAPILSERANAATAQALMRSRYTAYALHKHDYLAKTHISPSGQSTKIAHIASGNRGVHWIKLDIVATHKGMYNDVFGEVTFIAHYMAQGKKGFIKEESMFTRIKGLWVYRSGSTHPTSSPKF